MSCVLRAGGTNFAVNEFLASSAIRPTATFHRGEPRFATSQPNGPKLNASGFNMVASQTDFADIEIQITEAIHFLEQNQMELTRLVAYPGVEEVMLDFGIEERDIAAQTERFPPKLLSILGRLGIWLEFTLYPCPEPE